MAGTGGRGARGPLRRRDKARPPDALGGPWAAPPGPSPAAFGLLAGRVGADAPRRTANPQRRGLFKNTRSQWEPRRPPRGRGEEGRGEARAPRAAGTRDARARGAGGVARAERPQGSSSAALAESCVSPRAPAQVSAPTPLPAGRPPGGRGSRALGLGRGLALSLPPLLPVARGRCWRGGSRARPSPAGCGNGAAGFNLGTFPSILDAPRRCKRDVGRGGFGGSAPGSRPPCPLPPALQLRLPFPPPPPPQVRSERLLDGSLGGSAGPARGERGRRGPGGRGSGGAGVTPWRWSGRHGPEGRARPAWAPPGRPAGLGGALSPGVSAQPRNGSLGRWARCYPSSVPCGCFYLNCNAFKTSRATPCSSLQGPRGRARLQRGLLARTSCRAVRLGDPGQRPGDPRVQPGACVRACHLLREPGRGAGCPEPLGTWHITNTSESVTTLGSQVPQRTGWGAAGGEQRAP